MAVDLGARSSALRPTDSASTSFASGCLFGLVQVANTWDVRRLQRPGPGAELAGAGFGQRPQVQELRPHIFEPRPSAQDRQHRSHFTSRAASNVEESQQLIGCAAFESFGNVVRDRKRRTLELIAKGEPKPVPEDSEQLINKLVDLDRSSPDRELLEASVCPHTPPSKGAIRISSRQAKAESVGRRGRRTSAQVQRAISNFKSQISNSKPR